jgi:hypothetical protein
MSLGDLVTGTQRLSADGAVGPAGKAIRVYAFHFINGAGAGNLVLRNGTTATDTIYIQEPGTVSTGTSQDYHGGFLFPDGCFFDKDTNVASVVVSYSVEL